MYCVDLKSRSKVYTEITRGKGNSSSYTEVIGKK